jgi:hypothetical protein
MANTQTPRTPQTPPTPQPPAISPATGEGTVIIERTVISSNHSNASEPPQPPMTPRPPAQSGATESLAPVAGGAAIAAMIGPDTIFQVQLGISTAMIDGETVIHDHLRNANYRLNSGGSFIWSRISPQRTFAQLLADIRASHDAGRDTMDKTVAEFLGNLVDHGVLAASPLISQNR